MLWLLVIYCVLLGGVKAKGFTIGAAFEESENENNKKAFEVAIAVANSNRREDTQLAGFTATLSPHEPFPAIRTACDMIKDQIVGLFGPKSMSNIHAVQSVCDGKEIPHILTRWMYYSLPAGSAINFYPYAPLLTKAYWDIIQEWQWKTFTVLYEDDESLLRVSDLILLAKDQGLVVTVEQLDRERIGIYRDTLKKVWKTKQRFLVIDCDINHLVDILTQCQQVGLMTSDYSYFLTNLDAHTKDLSPFQYSQTNITGIRLINPDSPYVQDISSRIFKASPNEELFEISSKLETETALLFDAVQMFSQTLSALPDQVKAPKDLDCDEDTSWIYGYSLVNLIKTFSWLHTVGVDVFSVVAAYRFRRKSIGGASSENFIAEYLFDEPFSQPDEALRAETGRWSGTPCKSIKMSADFLIVRFRRTAFMVRPCKIWGTGKVSQVAFHAYIGIVRMFLQQIYKYQGSPSERSHNHYKYFISAKWAPDYRTKLM